jgi:predicted cupin superfamily sugar epimerase
MNPRAQSLITDLDLQPHPEGGIYREIFRSASRVQPGDHRADGDLFSVGVMNGDGIAIVFK